MNAFPAAKRTTIALLSLVFLVSGLALAEEGQGYLGVQLQSLSPSVAKALQLGDRSGVLVNEVVDGSPADKAGLQDGDVILVFAGTDTPDPGSLTKAVRKTEPGEEVDVVVLRDGEQKKIRVTVGETEQNVWFFDSDDEDAPHADMKTWTTKKGNKFHVMPGHDKMIEMHLDGDHDLLFIGEDRGYLGIKMEDLGEQLGDFFGVDDGEGALVTEVIEDSPAAEAGLKAGDVIVGIGDAEVESTMELHQEMTHTEADQEVTVKVMRQGKEKSFTVTLGVLPEDAVAKHMQKMIIDGEDVHFGGPRMLRQFGHGDGEHEIIIQRMKGPEGRVKIQRLHTTSEDDLDEVREELDALRKELQELRKELDDDD